MLLAATTVIYISLIYYNFHVTCAYIHVTQFTMFSAYALYLFVVPTPIAIFYVPVFNSFNILNKFDHILLQY